MVLRTLFLFSLAESRDLTSPGTDRFLLQGEGLSYNTEELQSAMKRQSGKPGQHFYHSLASDGILSIPAYRSKYFSDCCNLIHKQFFHAGYMICNENQIVELTEFSGFFLLILPIFWQEPTRKGWDYLGFQRWRKRHKEAKGFLKVGEKEEVGKI